MADVVDVELGGVRAVLDLDEQVVAVLEGETGLEAGGSSH